MRIALAIAALLIAAPAEAHWNGPSDPVMHAWFDTLASGKGLCCSVADGLALDDPDWGTESVAGADGAQIVYWVKVDGKKIAVPPEAVVTVPNKYGRAVVWPFQDVDGHTQIRCFMPGGGA